jgi:aspartyl-tRNA(Asn)/glutamyl-tRNA(Gln) amidotransferase subunit A
MTPDEIKDKDKDIHAFLEVFGDAQSGGTGPLAGVRIALKDNILFEGHRAGAASKVLEGYVASYDSTVVKKLKAAGATIVGRTNCDEFAMGSSTENSAYGVTKNPHDLERVAGGSSGGSAAAVAAGMCDVALGSDTGGSIRQPAAFCGIVGLKPTYGRVSRFGLIALASSLDQIGPFAKTVKEAQAIYDVIKGQDPMDSTTISDETYPRIKEFAKTIGIPRTFVESEGVSPEVKENFKEAMEKFKAAGYTLVDIELPHVAKALAVYYIIMPAEASSNLARFDGVKYGLHKEGVNGIEDYFETRGTGFGAEARRRIILGTYVLSSGYYDAYYGSALTMRDAITREFRDAFKQVDLILTPTTPTPAFKIGEKASDPLAMYLADIFTVPANIAGVPAISLPSGFADKLPLGIQLTADLGREDTLFVAGKDFLGED